MVFHKDKCKVLTVTLQRAVEHHLPFMTFFYTLDGSINTELDFIPSEKDLGILISSKLSWVKQVDALYSKASSRLGLVRRACHFVKPEKQKRVLYLSLVRSIFEHGAVIWHPGLAQVDRLEKIQRKGVKWILDEEYHHYNSSEYRVKLRKLDILPISSRLVLTDLLMFFDIVRGFSCVSLPDYVEKITPDDNTLGKLRSSHLDTDCYKSNISIDCLAFQFNFFNRSLSSWNALPRDIRVIEERSVFKTKNIAIK